MLVGRKVAAFRPDGCSSFQALHYAASGGVPRIRPMRQAPLGGDGTNPPPEGPAFTAQ